MAYTDIMTFSIPWALRPYPGTSSRARGKTFGCRKDIVRAVSADPGISCTQPRRRCDRGRAGAVLCRAEPSQPASDLDGGLLTNRPNDATLPPAPPRRARSGGKHYQGGAAGRSVCRTDGRKFRCSVVAAGGRGAPMDWGAADCQEVTTLGRQAWGGGGGQVRGGREDAGVRGRPLSSHLTGAGGVVAIHGCSPGPIVN